MPALHYFNLLKKSANISTNEKKKKNQIRSKKKKYFLYELF